jgi:hypothetical protein
LRRDLLRSISEEQDITNAIVLTHNIDFVFLQTVVLSAMKRCGHPTLTVLADAECASATYAHQAPVLHGLGVRFRVVPIEMSPGFRFHPKSLLLSGPSHAALYVGSGNLTFGGWRENAEVWARFDSRTDGTGALAAFRAYLGAVLDRVALSEPLRREIAEAYDPRTRQWAASLDEPRSLIGRASGGPSLLDQIFATLGGARVDGMTICAPYFDADAECLATIAGRVAPAPVTVLVQAGRNTLTATGLGRSGARPLLARATFRREDDDGHVREAFIHAKFYAFEHGGRVTLFLGSANCSRAALTIPGTAGNAELLSVLDMDADEFRGWLDDVVVEEGVPPLAIEAIEVPGPTLPLLRILGASYEAGYLHVAFSPTRYRITALYVDDLPADGFEMPTPGIVRLRTTRAPRQVSLTGTDGAASARSNPAWVDLEWELASTARGRGVADTVNRRVRPGDWGIGAWVELLDVFCAHLRYLPPGLAGAAGRTPVKPREPGKISYSATDVFSAEYGRRPLGAFLPALPNSPDGRVRSLQQLLLRWFRLPSAGGEEDNVDVPVPPDGDEDDVVDRPERLPDKPRIPTRPPPTDRDRRRAERLAAQLSEAMTSAEFLDERPPQLLAADVRVASALLRVALNEGWLAPPAFFQATHRIWAALFFSAADAECQLERRYRTAVSPEDFAASLRAPDVLAALAAWVLGVPSDVSTPEHARFALTAALAIARLPWLWDEAEEDDVFAELAGLLVSTDDAGEDVADNVTALGERWRRLVQRGHALRRLEAALIGQSPDKLCPLIRQLRVEAGDLLWQGRAGFCVVRRSAERTAAAKARALRLQTGKDESEFRGDLTVPMMGLLDASVLSETETFGVRPRSVLREFLIELARGFTGGPRRVPARP